MTRLDKLVVMLLAALLIFYIGSKHTPLTDDPMTGRRPMPPISQPPAAPTPAPERVRRPPLAPQSAFDPIAVVQDDNPTLSSVGTAFPVDDGRWMTARHVIFECAQLSLFRYGNPVAVASVRYEHALADLAIVESDRGGRPLTFNSRPLAVGEEGFAVGFPGGAVGAAYVRLMGRARMQSKGRLAGISPTLTWAEVRRVPETLETLGGISGGPMVDEEGGVVGVTVASSPRRGRVETIAPELLSDVRKAQLPGADLSSRPLDEVRQGADRLPQIADAVVRERRVALLYCRR